MTDKKTRPEDLSPQAETTTIAAVKLPAALPNVAAAGSARMRIASTPTPRRLSKGERKHVRRLKQARGKPVK